MAIGVAALLTAVWATVALAARPQPVEVASGRIAGLEWKFGVVAKHGKRCYLDTTLRAGWEGDGETCREGGVEGDWQRVTGDAGDSSDPAIEFDLTSRRVKTLRLTIHRFGGTRITHRRSFHPRLLTRRQSAASQMPQDFRYVVIAEPADFCVEAVEAISFGGRVVEKEAVPCEF